jgi:hypothetical protein
MTPKRRVVKADRRSNGGARQCRLVALLITERKREGKWHRRLATEVERRTIRVGGLAILPSMVAWLAIGRNREIYIRREGKFRDLGDIAGMLTC